MNSPDKPPESDEPWTQTGFVSLADASKARNNAKGHSDELTPEASPSFDELASTLLFSPSDGRIWLHRSRALILQAASFSDLRSALVASAGREHARKVLRQIGHAHGRRDAALVRERWPDVPVTAQFAAGPRIWTLQGLSKVTTQRFEFDAGTFAFNGDFIIHDSIEAEEYFGSETTDEPGCWWSAGYASGYTSEMLGAQVEYQEVECRCVGHSHCRLVAGRTADGLQRGGNTIEGDYLDAETLFRGVKTPVMIGESTAFRVAHELLTRVAPTLASVLINGESGTGKELFANGLHALSNRKDGPFVAINCAAIPEQLAESELFGVEKGAYTGAVATRQGRFERASGGTLFLDEIASLSPPAQAKLLRVLQERVVERVGGSRSIPVDVRLVAASNVNLADEVKAGRFREDLFFRLNVFPIALPPLRDRRDDIPQLMHHFFSAYCSRHGKSLKGFTPTARDALFHYSYPGNVRELQNLIERGVICADNESWIDKVHMFRGGEVLPNQTSMVVNLKGRLTAVDEGEAEADDSRSREKKGAKVGITETLQSFDDAERSLCEKALLACDGNVSAAARRLGISRAKLEHRAKQWGLLKVRPRRS